MVFETDCYEAVAEIDPLSKQTPKNDRCLKTKQSAQAGGCVETSIKFPKLISVVSEREMRHEAIHRRRIP